LQALVTDIAARGDTMQAPAFMHPPIREPACAAARRGVSTGPPPALHHACAGTGYPGGMARQTGCLGACER
jgi:hypothetical protein